MLVESAGRDIYAFHAGFGRDKISGKTDDGNPDTIGFAIGCLTEFGTVTDDLTINLKTGRVFETSAGTFKASPNAVSWQPGIIEYVTGGSGDDTITGDAEGNNIAGYSGDDTIDVSGDPSGEADFVNCDDGDDTVIKDPGDSTMGCEHVLP